MIIDNFKFNIVAAKIATYGELIEDIFNLTNQNGCKLTGNELIQLEKDITSQLDTSNESKQETKS
jgi:UTP:GlnB (protein PII) uridylyltransferase